MATHSSILAWEIPWGEEPGVLQAMGSKKKKEKETLIFFWLSLSSFSFF